MPTPDLDRQFLAIWRRALNQPLDSLTPPMIESWAKARDLNVENVEERDVGHFGKTKSIVLTVSGGQACFPKVSASGDPSWIQRRKRVDQNAALWEKMEWFAPLWVPQGKFQQLLKDTTHCTKERAIELFNYHTSTIYTLSFQAVCIAQIMPQAHSLKEFCPLAREAYLAFYGGYGAASIAALIPAIEGTLTRIVSSNGANLTLPEKINRVINQCIDYAAHLHFDQMWTPREYLTKDYLLGQDERIFFFETFRRWLHNSFFRSTGDYDGATWLNRHLFAHATSADWQQSGNFSRLVIALATLGVIESWHDKLHAITFWLPEMNADSTLLWQQAILHGTAQGVIKSVEEKKFHDNGRLVPQLPTDNGVLLRKALLARECIADLVRPLRKAGWSVDVGEADEQALFISVVAKSGEEKFTVTLLYSCATANDIYRKLAETSTVILYRGAPYHQSSYAYGLNIHVGPVTGWQPPYAPGRKRGKYFGIQEGIQNLLLFARFLKK